MKVGVLASGAGTNLQALIDRVHGRDGISIVGVASDKHDAGALERASRAGVTVAVFAGADFADREERDRAMAGWLADRVVAGFAFAAAPTPTKAAAVAAVRAAAKATRCHFLMTISSVGIGCARR